MDCCINCGRNLNAFNETYPLWPYTKERFCSRCNEKYQKFKTSNLPPNSKLTKDFIDDHFAQLQQLGFSTNGIKYIKDYIDYQESEAKAKAAEEKKRAADNERRKRAYEQAQANKANDVRNFIETTGNIVQGYTIVEYKGIQSGELVLGTGFLSEFSANVGDLFGTASITMAAKLTKAKQMALKELKTNCLKVNANAVIGVDIDINIMRDNILVVCANGTAVRIEKS